MLAFAVTQVAFIKNSFPRNSSHRKAVAVAAYPGDLTDTCLAPRVGVVLGANISDLLAHYVSRGLGNLKKVTLVPDWLPFSTISVHSQGLSRDFENRLPRHIRSLNVIFIGGGDWLELHGCV